MVRVSASGSVKLTIDSESGQTNNCEIDRPIRSFPAGRSALMRPYHDF